MPKSKVITQEQMRNDLNAWTKWLHSGKAFAHLDYDTKSLIKKMQDGTIAKGKNRKLIEVISNPTVQHVEAVLRNMGRTYPKQAQLMRMKWAFSLSALQISKKVGTNRTDIYAAIDNAEFIFCFMYDNLSDTDKAA